MKRWLSRGGATALWMLWVAPLSVLTVGALSTRWFFPEVIPRSITVRPAWRIVTARSTVESLRDGVIVSGIVALVAVALGWPAARVLAGPKAVGRSVALGVLFLPSLLPNVGLAMGIDVSLLRWGLAGSVTGVVVAHLVPVIPYAVAVLTAVFARHDERIEHQAAVLGASAWQRFSLVTLPLVRGGVGVALVLAFVVSWSQYLLTVLAGSGKVVTVTMLLFSALSGGNPTTIGVLALLAAAPAVVLLGLAGRQLTRLEPS